ncbi:type II secretion system secretin GspD [Roseinatronobacter alkalisoli]|uniref:Type II secretion system secretin GspD n=1 Tax=Roseinatronobacter alkalisoli TaxID=3028235 RepID=A0ABT5THP2_9RHOB|nr:type II secretion system secretin GspD [Roseinatronobacter sp. HJB301]MDD7973712.1 type II secretion system secretin GspD [Roseinatronobacter sp. HJB301]
MQRGTDLFLGEGMGGSANARAIVVPQDGETVQLSLVNASVEAAAQAVLSETLGLNFVIHNDVQGRITLQTTGPIPTSALLELFEAALEANGAQLRKEGNVVRIVSGTSGNRMFRVAGSDGVSGSNIVVAPLSYVSASEMVNLLAPLTEQGLKVVAEQRRNMLLLSGSATMIESALDAMNLFDVDVLSGKSVALVQLRAADPEQIVLELKSIFSSEEGGMLDGVVEFIPNPRLGSVLVISSRAAYIDRARRWIRNLDQAAASASSYLATYQLQNRSAEEVAPILNELLTGGGSGDEGGKALRVAADDSRNALVVMGDSSEHEQVTTLLRSLDSAMRQVLLEATIAEVTLNDEVSVGTRWFFESRNFNIRFSDLASGSTAGTYPGFTAILGGNDVNIALSALAGVTDVKVISSPTLMVLDNKEGVLQIGDQVPVALQNSTSGNAPNAPVLTQIDYRDTGIILRVRPRVGTGGRVLLDISQEVSEVALNRTSGIDSPTIRQRRVQTSVSLADGQTLALGGLVQERDSDSRSEVPGLGRIPVVGNLFRNRSGNKGRTELLILIRPLVIRDGSEAAAATQYWRGRLSQADGLLQTGLGSGRHRLQDFLQ